jgi:hypothetical protein
MPSFGEIFRGQNNPSFGDIFRRQSSGSPMAGAPSLNALNSLTNGYDREDQLWERENARADSLRTQGYARQDAMRNEDNAREDSLRREGYARDSRQDGQMRSMGDARRAQDYAHEDGIRREGYQQEQAARLDAGHTQFLRTQQQAQAVQQHSMERAEDKRQAEARRFQSEQSPSQQGLRTSAQPNPNAVMLQQAQAAGQGQEDDRLHASQVAQDRIDRQAMEGNVIQAAHNQPNLDVSTGGNGMVQYSGATQQQEEASRAATFARTKDNAANTARASLTALTGELQARGMGGAGYEGGQIGSTLAREANTIGEGDRQQAEEELRRAAEVANMQYQGGIAQRGQNLSTQSQNANRRQAQQSDSLSALQRLVPGVRY